MTALKITIFVKLQHVYSRIICEKLIDIHSQHQTLQLADAGFQFKILDGLANNINYLDSYKRSLILYGRLNKELNELLKTNQEAKQQYDYNLFLFYLSIVKTSVKPSLNLQSGLSLITTTIMFSKIKVTSIGQLFLESKTNSP